MTRKSVQMKEPTTLDKIRRIEHRIHTTKGDIEGLFENYLSDLILIRELRSTIAEEMLDPTNSPSRSDKSTTVRENVNVE